MPRIRPHRTASPSTLDANQVVAYNFRRARQRKGWTQDETAQHLEPHLGHRLTNGSISTIERSVDSERRPVFTAQELVAYALTFDVAVLWFFIPPAELEHATLDGLDGPLAELWRLAVGTDHQADDLAARLNELADVNPAAAHQCVASAIEAGAAERLRRKRRDMLEALIVEEHLAIDRLFGELQRLAARYETAQPSGLLGPAQGP
jgi:transcriptional regulator with XRE-family HTH domain